MRAINDSLLFHLSWKLFTQTSQCSNLIKARFLSYGLPRNRYFKSFIWPGVKDKLNMVAANSRWVIGDGEDIHLWLDNWLGESLVSLLNIHTRTFPSLHAKLTSVIVNGKWQLPSFIYDFPLVTNQIMEITLPISTLPDERIWIHASDGILSAKLAFNFLHPSPTQIYLGLLYLASVHPAISLLCILEADVV